MIGGPEASGHERTGRLRARRTVASVRGPDSRLLPLIRVAIPEPEDNAPVCGHLDRGEAPAVAGQSVDADPLRPQVLGVVDLLGELGGEPPMAAAGESLRGAIAEGANPRPPSVVIYGD